MAGDPIINAERRLKLDRRTKVITKKQFYKSFQEEVERYNRVKVFELIRRTE
jgi:hypothetical protein